MGLRAYPERMPVPPKASLGRDARWFAWAWVVLLALGIAGVLSTSTLVVRCSLTEVAEPTGWRDWPLEPLERSRALLDDGQLTTGVCPGGALSLAPYGVHEGAPVAAWVRSNPARDTFVVAAQPTREEAPRERFVAAARPAFGWHLAQPSREGAAGIAIVLLSLAVMIAGLLVSRRRLRDSDEQGLPAASGVLGGPHSYRVSSPAHALPAAPAAKPSPAQAIRTALVAVAALFGVGLAGAGCALALDVLRALR